MLYTLITLHRSGWTTQTFNNEEWALKTWNHVQTLNGKFASVLYDGATPIRSWVDADKAEEAVKPAASTP